MVNFSDFSGFSFFKEAFVWVGVLHHDPFTQLPSGAWHPPSRQVLIPLYEALLSRRFAAWPCTKRDCIDERSERNKKHVMIFCEKKVPCIKLSAKAPEYRPKSKTHRIHVWYIYLHLLILMVNVGRYTIHGSYGKGNESSSNHWIFRGELAVSFREWKAPSSNV